MKLRKVLVQLPVQFMLICLSLIALVPLYFMVITALKSRTDFIHHPLGLPQQISFEHISYLVAHGLLRQLFNTAALTILSCIIGIALAVLASFAFAKLTFRGREPLFNAIIALLSLPGIVVIVPLYATIAGMGLLNNYFGTSLVYAGFMLPFSVFVLTSFLRTVPQEILDAARIDGCGDFMSLVYIVVPLASPALATLFVVNALGVWNEFLVALLFMQKNELRTVVVELAMMRSRYSENIPPMLAGSLFVGLPIMIAFIFGQKYFVKGLASGAIK